MIAHTLIYQFDQSVSDVEQERFFAGLRDLVLDSGYVEGFDRKDHLWLPVDEHSKGMTGTTIARYTCPDLESLRKFSELPQVHEFIRGWRSRIQYRAAYANHEELSPRATS
ncbi:hypothetical protein GCM10012275_24680 [Longimycelium tulufanense]|uniref:Uncharacterized protein n=1 Tax=Longimycelium tulufanense TaxID=907463 RepID=A0A8J3FUT5_9PSEU|nr:hypothetical protein [Longimycelium tulufanense]GGM52777.1 hypothetical protein GCM10012275_24680 [Longimycelium tulufanense]